MMKGKKKSKKEVGHGSGLGKMKLESQPKQTASKNKNTTQQNRNASSTISTEPAKENFYDPWDENNTVSLKSNGWGSNVQSWKKQNGIATSNSIWDDSEDHFPSLGAESRPPKVNVWEERKCKAEAVKALEPQNEYDEEAMLKKALELSLMVAKEEEEKRRQDEEAYLMQIEALKIEEEQDNFSVPSGISPLSSRSESESPIIYHSVNEKYSVNSYSNNRNISDFNKREKVSNSGGARPKINKVIDRFGGWGLSEKDKKKMSSDERKKPQKLTDLVDNILDDDKSSAKFNPVNEQARKEEDIKMGHDLYSNEARDPWCTDEADNDKKIISVPLSSNNENMSDGKGTFTDFGVENDLDCADSMKKYAAPCDTTATRIEKLKNTEIKSSVETQAQIDRKNGDTTGFGSKESANYNKTDLKEQSECIGNNSYNLFENTYNYVANDCVTKDSIQSSGYKAFNMPNGDPWADSQPKFAVNIEPFSNKASYENSELKHETENVEFNNFIGGKIHTLEDFGSHSNIEPSDALLSQLSGSDMNAMHHETLANDAESHVLPPQLAHTLPQFPVISNPLFASNPMFPGSMNFSPMFGYVMDPIMMRQMLMLSNPYFASQLLTMEQYYRSLGMQTDLFSFQPQVIPNLAPPAPPPAAASEVLGSSTEQSAVPNVNTDVSVNSYDPEFQNYSLTDQSKPVPEDTHYETSFGKHIKPPGLDISIAQPDISSTNRDGDDDDCWFKNYMCSDDTLPIPPPKPAALNVDECNSSISISKPLESNQNSCNFDSMQPGVSKMDDISCKTVSSAQEDKVESSKSVSAVEACVNKTVVHGWSDSEDESTDSIKPKNTYSWDDGWGDDNLPAKSVKNSTVYDERRKPAYRQPASQPQVSRFQRSKRYK